LTLSLFISITKNIFCFRTPGLPPNSEAGGNEPPHENRDPRFALSQELEAKQTLLDQLRALGNSSDHREWRIMFIILMSPGPISERALPDWDGLAAYFSYPV
jgi:hypothetical protein